MARNGNSSCPWAGVDPLLQSHGVLPVGDRQNDAHPAYYLLEEQVSLHLSDCSLIIWYNSLTHYTFFFETLCLSITLETKRPSQIPRPRHIDTSSIWQEWKCKVVVLIRTTNSFMYKPLRSSALHALVSLNQVVSLCSALSLPKLFISSMKPVPYPSRSHQSHCQRSYFVWSLPFLLSLLSIVYGSLFMTVVHCLPLLSLLIIWCSSFVAQRPFALLSQCPSFVVCCLSFIVHRGLLIVHCLLFVGWLALAATLSSLQALEEKRKKDVEEASMFGNHKGGKSSPDALATLVAKDVKFSYVMALPQS